MPFDIPIWAKGLVGPIVSKMVALQTFFFGRPRIDIDIISDPENLYGQKSYGYSAKQRLPEPILQTEADFDLEFFWNLIVRIKNNSSKTAYNVHIEKINLDFRDYSEKIDRLQSLKEGEIVELKYFSSYRANVNRYEGEKYKQPFPGHLEKIEVIVKYQNESRTTFYTKYTKNMTESKNEHLLRKPK